jgi:PBSX family phage terminase large subunit
MSKKNKVSRFKFKEFSRKQKKILKWWEHTIINNYDFIIADGAIRSGKTISLICSFLKWSQTNFDNENFIIAGKSIGALKRNVIDPMRQIVNAWGWKDDYNISGNFIDIGTNTYHMFGANTEASQDTLQGLTSAGALADEIVLFPRSFVDQMIGRCSVEGAKIFGNCNPNNPYHYFKTEFIDKAVEKMIYYLHFTMDDNLTLSEKVKDKYKRMFTGVFYKRYILGLWVMAEGIIYDMFDESKHVIDTSFIKDFDQYYLSLDYGVHNAFSAGLWGSKSGIWHRIKEYYYSGKDKGKQKDNEAYYKDLIDFIGNRKIKSVIIDPSASSFIQTIKKYGKLHARNAKNDVKQGIENTSSALNEGKIYIDKNCKNTIKEFYSYSWDEKAALRGEDKPIKQNDHTMDDLRYFVNTIIYNNEPAILF